MGVVFVIYEVCVYVTIIFRNKSVLNSACENRVWFNALVPWLVA